MEDYLTLRINGEEHKIDLNPDNFTAGELNGVERNTGMAWYEWFTKLADRRVSSLAWTALAWIAVRRAGSFVPFDEFEDSIKVMELVASANPNEAAPAAEAAQRKRRSTK